MSIEIINTKNSKSSIKSIQKLISAHRKLRNVAMMNNVPDAVRCFLDIEAQVGDEEDDDGYGDGPPGKLTPALPTSAVNLFAF
jgi:hypothetical protein